MPGLFDGDRLRQARLYHGLRKTEVASKLDVSPAIIGQYESGRTRPSSGAFASMALQLGFPPEFFERRGTPTRVAESDAHFRKLRSTSKLERDRALVRLELFAEVLADIESHVQLPDADVPAFPVSDDSAEALPEEAAKAVRAGWGLGLGPIDHVVRLLEGRGIVVTRNEIGASGVDAFSTWLPHRPVVVLGSDKDDAARSRFDAAHELGHLVMHADAEPGRHVVENQAHRFAAGCLMPAETIAKEFPSRMSWPAFFKLKARWHVSLQALLMRAKTLGVLSPDGYRRGQIQVRTRWGNDEPVDIGASEQPALLRRAFDLMASELGLDAIEIAAECRLPERVFTSLIEGSVAGRPNRPRVEVGS